MAPLSRKNNHSSIKQIVLMMGLGMPLAPVRAEFPDVSVFADAVEVDDSELAEMRGKFVSPGQIAYFGVEMMTQWQTGSGEVLSAGMKMDMKLPTEGSGTPVVKFVPVVSIQANPATNGGTAHTELPTASISSKGLSNISGVVQSIQLGGNENQVNNAIKMDVAISTAPVVKNPPLPATPDITPVTVQETTDSGAVALAGADQNGIQVYTYVPNQGEILQRIGNNNVSGNGTIMQSARLVGDQHRVVNTIAISAGFNAVNDNASFNNSTQFDLRNLY